MHTTPFIKPSHMRNAAAPTIQPGIMVQLKVTVTPVLYSIGIFCPTALQFIWWMSFSGTYLGVHEHPNIDLPSVVHLHIQCHVPEHTAVVTGTVRL